MANGPIIHRRKLFDGQITAEELHRREVWGRERCHACRGRPVVIEIRSSILVKDLPPLVQSAMVLDMAAGIQKWAPFDTKYGKAVQSGQVFACAACAKDAERAAARGPSYALVHIDRGVGADNPVVQVL